MVILGLGGNIGDRARYLQAAADRLAALVSDMRCSRVLESSALLPENAPPEFDKPYLNLVLIGQTRLNPTELLTELKTIERALGRQERCNWGPREIDIDILAMDNNVIDASGLSVPHRELLNRDFALLPLTDVAPDWHYPLAGEYYDMTAVQIAAVKGYVLSDKLRDTGIIIHV